MKKRIKFLSLILAVIMLMLAVPFTGVAKTLTSSEDNLSELDLLLELDNLADTSNNVLDSTHKITGTHIQNVGVSGDAITFTPNASFAAWGSYICKTDVPLSATSQYVITFNADAEVVSRIFGFSFSGDSSNNLQSCFYGDGYYYYSKGMTWASGVDAANKLAATLDIQQTHSYIIALDNKTVTLYCDGESVYSYTLGEDYSTNYLSIGLRARGNGTTGEDGIIAKMTDIKVYEGAYRQEHFNNYKDGDILLKMDTVLSTDFTSDFEDVTVVAQRQGFQNSTTGEEPDTLYASTATGGWVMGGVKTNLPLDENSKYTIEFYMKKYVAAKVGFCWGVDAWNNSQGIYPYENSINSVYGYTSGAYGTVGSCSQLWSKYADNEGFTRFTIEINGYVATVYVGGVTVGTVDVSKTPVNSDDVAVGEAGYISDTLGLALKARCDDNSLTPNCTIASIKNLTVYSGNIVTNSKVQFVKGNEVVAARFVAPGGTLAATDFPAVEPETAGNVIRWFYQGTNVMVLAPYQVVADTVIEAREINPAAYTSVAGVQYTAPADNEQSVRFIARLYTLQASEAGFEVYARYKDGDTVKTDKEWIKKTKTVYSSINATVNGTVNTITAKELGSTYLIALSIDDVPTNIGQIDFYVRSFIKVNGENQYSEWVCCTMNNGEISQDLNPLIETN